VVAAAILTEVEATTHMGLATTTIRALAETREAVTTMVHPTLDLVWEQVEQVEEEMTPTAPATLALRASAETREAVTTMAHPTLALRAMVETKVAATTTALATLAILALQAMAATTHTTAPTQAAASRVIPQQASCWRRPVVYSRKKAWSRRAKRSVLRLARMSVATAQETRTIKLSSQRPCLAEFLMGGLLMKWTEGWMMMIYAMRQCQPLRLDLLLASYDTSHVSLTRLNTKNGFF